MSITAKLFLDGRHTKNDGTQPIKIRVTINRKSTEWTTGHTVQPKYWNAKTQHI